MERTEKDCKKDWETIVKLHIETKRLVLLAEELDRKLEFFWPPMIQQRDALDHIIRAERVRYNPELTIRRGLNAEEYCAKQMDKAVGHIYRAYFDVADWISIILRQQISTIFDRYSRDSILKVLDGYAVEVEQLVDEASRTIANYRTEKDIGNSITLAGVEGQIDEKDFPEVVVEYGKLIKILDSCLQRVLASVPELDEQEYGKSK